METIEQKTETGLQILDEKEASLVELSQKFRGLKITSASDRDGYKAVREARIALKNARVQVEKDGKALRDNAVRFSKRVIEREKELIKIIEPTEFELRVQEEEYEKALEAIKIEKERKEKERIQNRIQSLAKFNYALDLYDVSTMPDDKFNELLTQVEIDYNAEQERIAAEKAEQERLRNEEAERLRSEREEIARQRAELEAAQRKADLELAERSRKEREWIEADNKRKAEMQAERDRIEAEQKKLKEDKRQHEEQLRLEQAKKEAAERARLEEINRVKHEAEEKADRERLEKMEAERQEALKPDKDKLMTYAHALMSVPFPELTHKDAVKVKNTITDHVNQSVKFIQDKAGQL
jgi:hypothetical protein